MKQEVIAVLANQELNPKQKFNALLTLYREHRAHVQQTMRYLNSVGFSPINLKNLEYDIQKLYEIKDVEIAEQKAPKAEAPKSKKGKAKRAKAPKAPKTETPAMGTKTTTTEIDEDAINYDALSYQDLKKEAAKRAAETGEAPADQRKATLLDYLKKKA